MAVGAGVPLVVWVGVVVVFEGAFVGVVAPELVVPVGQDVLCTVQVRVVSAAVVR